MFDKSRGVGGRLSTRRSDEVFHNHGAQFITVSGEAFRAQMDRWLAAGVARRYDGRVATVRQGKSEVLPDLRPRYVGVPSMNAIARHVADGTNVVLNCTIESAMPDGSAWQLRCQGGVQRGPFDVLILTPPAPQTLKLIGDDDPFAPSLKATRILPTWSLLLEFSRSLALGYEGAYVADSPISWLMCTAGCARAWTVHASQTWSLEHLEEPAEQVARALCDAFADVTGVREPPLKATAHRWRYAFVVEPVGVPCLWDERRRLGLAGDWCIGARMESAFESGRAVAEAVLRSL
jgi:predicted NAD/FAD-dependent oxidoreductase